jgi:hypothetical protein
MILTKLEFQMKILIFKIRVYQQMRILILKIVNKLLTKSNKLGKQTEKDIGRLQEKIEIFKLS